jgi:hypothetical protein
MNSIFLARVIHHPPPLMTILTYYPFTFKLFNSLLLSHHFPIITTMSEGLYCVNCQNDAGNRRSGIAFYEDLGAKSVTFATGVRVTWNIHINAHKAKFQSSVGQATNGFHNWTVKRDDERFVFRNSDGFNCTSIYFAN